MCVNTFRTVQSYKYSDRRSTISVSIEANKCHIYNDTIKKPSVNSNYLYSPTNSSLLFFEFFVVFARLLVAVARNDHQVATERLHRQGPGGGPDPLRVSVLYVSLRTWTRASPTEWWDSELSKS